MINRSMKKMLNTNFTSFKLKIMVQNYKNWMIKRMKFQLLLIGNYHQQNSTAYGTLSYVTQMLRSNYSILFKLPCSFLIVGSIVTSSVGIELCGFPGTGKTSLRKALAKKRMECSHLSFKKCFKPLNIIFLFFLTHASPYIIFQISYFGYQSIALIKHK